MRVNERRLGLAAAVVAALSYTLCALLVALAPGGTTGSFGFVLHLSVGDVAREISWTSYAIGVVVFSVVVGAHAWAVGWTYNRFALAAVAEPRPVRQVV